MMTVLFAIGFVLLHAALILQMPAHATIVSYAFLVTAPLLASTAAIRRGLIAGFAPSRGWSMVVLSLLLWTLGMFSSLRLDLLGNSNEAPGEAMLFYILYGVPISYAVATVGGEHSSFLQRALDAVLALSLGYLYFALMFSLTSLQGVSNARSTQMIADMFDVENAFLAVTTTLRFFAADTSQQRHLFGALCVFTCVYAAMAAYYNHYVAMNVAPDIGSLYDLVIDIPFLLFLLMTWRTPGRFTQMSHKPTGLVRFVRIGSPLLLALSVLTVALLLLRQRFELGVAGVIVAVLGYGLRSILSQARHIEAADKLRSDQTILTELALHDGLTGVLNRRAFEEALEREWRMALRNQQTLSLLMVDLDLFKQYNDRYGHLAGDACLRDVADVIQHALQRPSDVLARYGGEEFALILPNTSSNSAKEVATRLCTMVQQLNIHHYDHPLGQVTISVGMASITPIEGATPDVLVAAADGALYVAKHKGRNRVEQSI